MYVITPEQALQIKRGEMTHEDIEDQTTTVNEAIFGMRLEVDETDEADAYIKDMTRAEEVLRKGGLRKADDYADKMMDLFIQLHDITGKIIKLHIERTTENDTVKH